MTGWNDCLAIAHRPMQLVVAGKAHPADEEGKRMIAEWVAFTEHPRLWERVVFLEDYDIALAQELVQGVDVWINTPRRPWEACGTSGMKVLANGGLNLSELDGWWAEAYRAGPRLGDRNHHATGRRRHRMPQMPGNSMRRWNGRWRKRSMTATPRASRAPGSPASAAAWRC